MIAFGIDVGYIVTVQADLQNASDAAALAGADALTDGYVDYSLPGQTQDAKDAILDATLTAARTRAKQYASYNGAGDSKSLTLRDEDISFGFTDKNASYTPYTTTGTSKQFPNTIKVRLRRDDTANGSVNLFFAPILGKDESNLTATAAAAIYVGTLDTLKSKGNRLLVLPMTYDEDHWDEFVKTGKDPDGSVSIAASNGLPEVLVYPSVKYKGNFGQLSLDGVHDGASTTMGWIHDGIAESDIDSLINLNHLPLSKRDKTQWNWIGNPGMKASTIMAVNDYVGETFLLPLYKAKNPGTGSPPEGYEAGVGQGSHHYYNITQFVGIRIMQPDKTNKEIVVQPAPMVVADDYLMQGSIVPAGEESTFSTIFASPRLTR